MVPVKRAPRDGARGRTFLSDNGVIARDVSADIAGSYTYDFLSRATGKSPAELGLNK